jgi:uncharacterized membrane protein
LKQARIAIGIMLLLFLTAGAGVEKANRGFLTVHEILRSNCLRCHNWALTYEGITDPLRVTPGSPEKSPLYTMVDSGRMPLGRAPLSVAEKDLLRAWIAAGATRSEKPLTLP